MNSNDLAQGAAQEIPIVNPESYTKEYFNYAQPGIKELLWVIIVLLSIIIILLTIKIIFDCINNKKNKEID